MKKLCMAMTLIMILFNAILANAGWLIYSKPEFRGRVIDAETKEPIAGAVVVATYWAEQVIGGPGGQSSSIIHVKETLTDAKGEFNFVSYTTALNPFYHEDFVRFIIFKPGYLSSYGPDIKVPIEYFFTTDVIGKEAEIKYNSYSATFIWRGPIGVLELIRAKTSHDRLIASPLTPGDYDQKDLPLLFKIIDEDRKKRGLEVR